MGAKERGFQLMENDVGLVGRIGYPENMITLEHSPVHSDPKVLGGTLVFRGTRVKAQTLLDYLDSGDTLEEFLADFPTVSRDNANLFLQLAREEGDSR
jgi:uncharacterized protein (DUF433 family)